MFQRPVKRTGQQNDRQRGLSFVEVLAAITILLIIATAVVPMYHWYEKRRLEKQLKIGLEMMRNAIDQYKKYVDEGLIIQEDVDQKGYPPDLETLVEGVELGDENSPETRTIKLLYTIPVDPFTGYEEWGLRSYQDDWDSDSWGGENVYDVYSLSDGIALDGTYYRDW